MAKRALTLCIAISLLVPRAALAQSVIDITAAKSGINGESLADTPVSDAIDMLEERWANQLSLTLTVTPGTSTTFTVRCYGSETGAASTWAQISFCSAAAASTCGPTVRTYTLADYETQNAKKVIESDWPARKRWVQCKLDDAADGTGTVVVTGTRSRQ